jgi:pimeloyl-ACP methyl ester carboxylesterase
MRAPVAVVLFVLALVALVSAPGAQAAPSYPVVFNITAASGVLADPTGPPPGANDWSCKPSAAHPNPVVLVHGLGATMGENWASYAPMLADAGYCVFALTYGTNPNDPYVGGLQPMEQSSAELATFVAQVLAATGAQRVDLVGHSEGTVMPQYYLKFRGGAQYVDKYVAITPLYQGTTLLGIAALEIAYEKAFPQYAAQFEAGFGKFCGSCLEFVRGSAFLKHLYADGVFAVPGVTYTTIMTRYDELVTPYTSGRLTAPNATNIVVQNQCALDLTDHVAAAFDPNIGRDVLNALDPAHQQRVVCHVVLPLVGAPLN